MQESQGTSIFFFFFFFILLLSSTRGETMSREELVSLAGYGEEKLSSVVVMGSLMCEGSQSHVQGAKLIVECKTNDKRRRINWIHGITDGYGEFFVDIPSHLHAIPKLEEACVVRVLRLPIISSCRCVPRINPKIIILLSAENGIRVYTTGTIKLNDRLKLTW